MVLPGWGMARHACVGEKVAPRMLESVIDCGDCRLTRLPEASMVPLNWIAVGDPAVILPPGDHDKIWAIQKPLNFPRYVFGVDRPAEGETMMPSVMPRYAAALRRCHAGDREITATS